MNDPAQEAILAALKGFWKQAAKLNLRILEESPQNTEAMNRLARAYSELNDLKKARETCQKVLKIDPFNIIAQKSLSKWKGLRTNNNTNLITTTGNSFLEEPGKTKIITLLNLGDPSVITLLDSGDEVRILCTRYKVSVTTKTGKYIGRLPDDLSARLRKLIKLGNLYQVLIKSAYLGEVKVFIREVTRSEKSKDIVSFPLSLTETVQELKDKILSDNYL